MAPRLWPFGLAPFPGLSGPALGCEEKDFSSVYMWLFSNFDVQTFDQHPGPVSPHPTSAVSHLRVFRMLQWIHIKFVKLVPTLEIKGDIWDVCELGLCALV